MREFIEQIKGENFDWYVIVSRGGLRLASALAQETGCWKIDTICFKSYEDGVQSEMQYAVKNLAHLEGKRVLLIDDLVDSGRTMKLAVTELKRCCVSEVKTLVLLKKASAELKPDFYLKEIQDYSWVTFPWECSQLDTASKWLKCCIVSARSK